MEKTSQPSRMLTGPLWNKILLYTLPLAATGILQQFFNAADMAVVGRFTGDLGPTAMAAVGSNAPVVGLALNTFMGISLGSNVVIANSVGSGDEKTVKKAVHTSVVFAVLAGIVISVFAEILSSFIISGQKLPDEVYPYALTYFRIYMAGTAVILLYNFEASVFRAMGDTKTPLIVLFFSGVLNVLLNLFFVAVIKMTVEGVAISTLISNLVSAMILFYILLRTDSPARIELKKLRIHGHVLLKILRIGVPAGLQAMVFNLANVIIQGAINSLGTIVIAASSAAFNIEVFVYHVVNSFSQACTTFTGQNFGGNRTDRCKKVIVLCLLEGIVFMGISIALVLTFGSDLLSIFNSDPDVIKVGYTRLIYIFSAYTFTLTYEVVSGYLRGFGISFVPALFTVAGVCGVRITWIYTVFPAHRTFENIMIVYPLSLATTAFLMLIALAIFRPAKKWAKRNGL